MRKGSMEGRRIDPGRGGVGIESLNWWKKYVLAEWYAFTDICAGI